MSKGEPDQEAVRILQTALRDLKYPMPKSFGADGKADGGYGQETADTVWKFQRDKGLSADGVAGKNTLAKLDQAVMSLPAPLPSTAPPASTSNPLALAKQAVPTVTAWAFMGASSCVSYKALALSTLPDVLGVHKVTVDALGSHFHVAPSNSRLTIYLDFIVRVFRSAQSTAANANATFRYVDRVTAAGHFNKASDPKWAPPPAYILRGTPFVHFTDSFTTGFGPFCRAAMVLHECAHFADATVADHAYEHQAAYANLTVDQATRNASSYPTFAAHVTRGFDRPRFGAGNPAL